jgi:hypothetical protein
MKSFGDYSGNESYSPDENIRSHFKRGFFYSGFGRTSHNSKANESAIRGI